MADDGGQGTGAGDRRVRLGDAGVTVIAPTRRADGTWRKARRVREGYVPPDEVASYQAAPARIRAERATAGPVGAAPRTVRGRGAATTGSAGVVAEVSGPPLTKAQKKNEARRRKRLQQRKEAEEAALAKLVQGASLEDATAPDSAAAATAVAAAAPQTGPAAGAGTGAAAAPAVATATAASSGNPKKRLRAVNKKLRQIEALEQRVAAGGEPLSEAEATKVAGKAALEAEARELQVALQ